MADLPVAAIACIAVGLYVAVIIGLIVLCYFLKGRGRCSGGCNCCAKKEGEQSCECCIAMAEACNCCQGPSLRSCLHSCCPNKKVSCVDIIMCQCCSSDGTTLCDIQCCRRCRREDPDTCNCLCLEIRLRSSSHHRDGGDHKAVTPAPPGTTKQAWMSDPHPLFHGIPSLPDPDGGFRSLWVGDGGHSDLQLDLGWFRNNAAGAAAYPVSTHPIHTGRSQASGDLVPTSTPRFHQGRSQLFIRPGVHSAGRVIAKRQSLQWTAAASTGRRWSSRRRSSRRIRSPEIPQRSLSQRRQSSRVTANLRSASRRQSQREPMSPLPYQEEEGDEAWFRRGML
ncbi:uncharacterized protein LOC143274885 [Babylonia areolata]|uniref:uncharacterized protein LOC143274885 n=1 Tax=Babylonia areolata TaxID=304850 RepID=UPI003FD48F8B